MNRIKEFMKKISDGEPFTREEYTIVINSNPDKTFKIHPAQLMPYPARLMADEIFMDLHAMVDKSNSEEVATIALFRDEHFNLLDRISNTLEGLISEVSPYTRQLSGYDYDDFKMMGIRGEDIVHYEDIPFVALLEDESVFQMRSRRPQDTSRYVGALSDTDDDKYMRIFSKLLSKKINLITTADLVYLYSKDGLASSLEVMLTNVKDEYSNINITETRVDAYDAYLDPRIVTVTKLIATICEL